MKNWYQNLKQTVSVPAHKIATRPTAAIEFDRAKPQRMIILPPRGVRAGGFAALASEPSVSAPLAARTLLMSLGGGAPSFTRLRGMRAPKLKVIDSVGEDAAKLVEIAPSELHALRSAYPGLRVVPEVFYKPAVHLYFVESKAKAATASATRKCVFTVTANGKGVGGATIVAFTDFAARAGAEAVTNASGTATIRLPSRIKKLERIYVYPESGCWGALKKNVAVGDINIALVPIDLGYSDGVRHFYGEGADSDGSGVKVGVVDSGVALNHPDLKVAGGLCTVSGESPNDYGPIGGPHGTHVAGIIAARGKPPKGIRGIAPAASLYSYRVFPAQGGASNFSIIKAIDRAIQDGCDLVNMSLGGGPRDAALESAIGDAHLAGTVCIVAAGNDDRGPVSEPAAYQLCVAVSAMGRKGTFPAGAVESGEIARPYGTDPKNFVAAFSNIGPEIDVTGPGVGIISTVPGGYEVMSGTSMACPAVTGITARMLGSAAHQAIRTAARDESRANSIVQMVRTSSHLLGFKPEPDYEGAGLPEA